MNIAFQQLGRDMRRYYDSGKKIDSATGILCYHLIIPNAPFWLPHETFILQKFLDGLEQDDYCYILDHNGDRPKLCFLISEREYHQCTWGNNMKFHKHEKGYLRVIQFDFDYEEPRIYHILYQKTSFESPPLKYKRFSEITTEELRGFIDETAMDRIVQDKIKHLESEVCDLENKSSEKKTEIERLRAESR